MDGDPYENLFSHLSHHTAEAAARRGEKNPEQCGIKRALLDMCKREDARTIREAVERIPEHRLARRLARALAKEY